MANPSALHNPQLEGAAFLWEAGPVGVVLSHGLTATAAEVRPLARRLHQQGLTVAGPLLPGHGTTPEDANRFRWQDWADAVEASYKEVAARCRRVFIGGESTGALLALYLASRYPDVDGLLLYAPALRLKLSDFDLFRLRLLAPFVMGIPKESLDTADVWQGYPVNPLKAAVQLLHLQDEVRKLLPDIHQPILIIHGRLDTTVHPEAPQTIYDQVFSEIEELHWMERSAHTVILDRELDQVTELTIKFIQRALQAGGGKS